MFIFRIGLLASTILSAMPAAARTVSAPAATAEQADTAAPSKDIIVTGQRRLSRAPQDAKRSSLAVVDSVGALEIQKLTDQTVVDALTRVPGVSLQRGYQFQKGWYATIRGLDGNYNSVDLDGGMFFDSTRNDRAVYLDTVPAMAINELVVTKTVTPDMDANSIGGHISINTLRAFDLNGAAVTKGDFGLNLYQNGGAPDRHGPGKIGNLVVKRTFGANGDFGFVGSASFHDDRYSQTYNNTSAYIVRNGIDVPTSALQRGDFDVHDKGFSLLGKLEARSADRFYGFVETTYFNSDILQNNYRGGTSVNAANVTAASEGQGSFTGASAQAYSRVYDISRKLWTITTGGELKTSDNSKIKAVASMESSHHDETLENGAIYTFGGLSGKYGVGDNQVDLALDPATGLSNPANWSANPSSNAVVTHLPMTDKVYTARLDYNLNSFPFSEGLGLSTGVNWRRLHRVFNQSADNYTLPTGTPYTLDKVLVNGGAGSIFDGQGVVYVDHDAYWSFVKANGTNKPTTTPSSSFDLTEDVLAGYGAVHYNSGNLHALAGARYEKTIVDDDTAKLQNGAPVPFSFHRSYDYLLPNVQASVDVMPMLRLKAAYTETIARPTPTTFAQGLTINNFSSLNVMLRGSNPDLKARHSRNYDLSVESYLPHGYLSAGLFHKDISGEVYYLTTTTSDPTTGVATQLSTPYNAASSKVSGLELSGEWRDFTALASWLEGFTLRANYTRLWGRLDVLNADKTGRTIDALNQQPSYMANVMAVYDRGPLTGSLAYAKRGQAFNGGVGATSAGDTYIQPYDSLDARVAVRPIEHLEMFLAARNLTNSWWREMTGVNRDQLLTAIRSGRSFTVGAQFRF
ncbi:TonB-dependent receptor [Sphingomonadaceae bacterium jetA1]|uniref:TonB-dependent receptor n=1 Tax=Facivitalis istanbulensis TaxID=3075838 RepID=UPI0034839142